jgi:hypothetical protein
MSTPESYRLRFIADEAFIDQLRQEPGIAIESEAAEKDATLLGFDLVTAASIVTVIQGALYLGELAFRIRQALAVSKSNKIVLQAPFGTLELVKNAPLSEEQIRNFLESAQKLQK